MAMDALNWARSVLVLWKCFKWFSCIQWSTSTMLYGSNADGETSINFNSNWWHSYAMNSNTFKFAINAIHTNGAGAYIGSSVQLAPSAVRLCYNNKCHGQRGQCKCGWLVELITQRTLKNCGLGPPFSLWVFHDFDRNMMQMMEAMILMQKQQQPLITQSKVALNQLRICIHIQWIDVCFSALWQTTMNQWTAIVRMRCEIIRCN